MKKLWIALLLALLLTGCKTVHEIRPDTIVDIPLNPTRPAEEEVETEPVTEAPTRPPAPEIPTNPAVTPEETTAPTQSFDPGSVAAAVNAARQAHGLPPLVPDPRLSAIAAVRARETAAFWSGDRPDGNKWTTVLEEYGYAYTHAGENLYAGTGRAEDVVSRWMGDAETKGRILMDAVVIGVGSYTAPDGTVYVAALMVGTD